jgi:hypothetical protein
MQLSILRQTHGMGRSWMGRKSPVYADIATRLEDIHRQIGQGLYVAGVLELTGGSHSEVPQNSFLVA